MHSVHMLEIQEVRTSKGLVGASDIWRYKVERDTKGELKTAVEEQFQSIGSIQFGNELIKSQGMPKERHFDNLMWHKK